MFYISSKYEEKFNGTFDTPIPSIRKLGPSGLVLICREHRDNVAAYLSHPQFTSEFNKKHKKTFFQLQKTF